MFQCWRVSVCTNWPFHTWKDVWCTKKVKGPSECWCFPLKTHQPKHPFEVCWRTEETHCFQMLQWRDSHFSVINEDSVLPCIKVEHPAKAEYIFFPNHQANRVLFAGSQKGFGQSILRSKILDLIDSWSNPVEFDVFIWYYQMSTPLNGKRRGGKRLSSNVVQKWNITLIVVNRSSL